MKTLPRYPIYIPSKGRSDRSLTANFLIKDGVPFYLVIEEQEYDLYAAKFSAEQILVLPFSDQGSVIPARNWIKDHATAAGHKRHWQLDDNMMKTARLYRGKKIACDAGVAFAAAEDFTDRYTNVAVSGLNYTMFAYPVHKVPPFYLNTRVYSCSLILNSIPHKWRGTYNEDTDLCLQVLADGWCTILFNAFLIQKMHTMTMTGGNTSEIYQDDGRLKMARSLERVWPGVVGTDRRFRRPQHVIKDQWTRFDTKLQLRDDLDLDKLAENEYGLKLKQVAPKIESADLKNLLDDKIDK